MTNAILGSVQARPVVVVKRGVGFKPVLENSGKTTFKMDKLKKMLYAKPPNPRKPPKNQKRPKLNNKRM